MSKATIVKGNKVVATADTVKEARAYAKKVGGTALVPAKAPKKAKPKTAKPKAKVKRKTKARK